VSVGTRENTAVARWKGVAEISVIRADGSLQNGQGMCRPAMAAAAVNHVLFLEHDIDEVRFVKSTLARTGWTDILLWHEPILNRGLTLLGLCEFQLILLGVSLPELPVHAVLRVIDQCAPGTPVVVMRDVAENGDPMPTALETQLAHVRAVVGRKDIAGILSAVRSTLGLWERLE